MEFWYMPISDKMLFKKLGIHIRQLREEKNLTQEDLAVDSELPRLRIGKIERAETNPTLSTLNKIATALDIELQDLFNF